AESDRLVSHGVLRSRSVLEWLRCTSRTAPPFDHSQKASRQDPTNTDRRLPQGEGGGVQWLVSCPPMPHHPDAVSLESLHDDAAPKPAFPLSLRTRAVSETHQSTSALHRIAYLDASCSPEAEGRLPAMCRYRCAAIAEQPIQIPWLLRTRDLSSIT